MFVKTHDKDVLVVQVYVDDILFGFTNKFLCNVLTDMIRKQFEMSMMENLCSFSDCKSNKSNQVHLSVKESTPLI